VIASGGRQVTAGVQLYPPSAANPVTPAPVAGDLYYNTTIHELMFYDAGRGKWLANDTETIYAGRNGNTLDGNFFRGIDGLLLNAANVGIPVLKGTLVSLALSRGNAGAAVLEVLNNGTVVATLANSVAGATRSDTMNANVSGGLISFRNQVGGSTMTDVQIIAIFKKRP